MNQSSVVSAGASSRYAVLAANVSQVISNSSGRVLEPAEKKLLDRASDLVDKIVQGSRFIELSESHALSKPQENLFAFDHAISALNDFGLSPEVEKELTKFFEALKQTIHKIANNERVDEADKDLVKRFFNALCDLFYREVANSAFKGAESDFERVTI